MCVACRLRNACDMHAERPLVSVSIQLVLASVHQARISQDAWLECVLISGFTMSLPTVCIQQLWIGCGTGTGRAWYAFMQCMVQEFV